MGTNYYLETTQPFETTTYPKWSGLRPKSEILRLHIGKHSYGWKFMFRKGIQKEYGDLVFEITSLQSVKNFVRSGNWQVVDEYNNVILMSDFLGMVLTTEREEKCHFTFCNENHLGRTDVSLDIYGFSWIDGEFS
jgi:hypothetical protein